MKKASIGMLFILEGQMMEEINLNHRYWCFGFNQYYPYGGVMIDERIQNQTTEA